MELESCLATGSGVFQTIGFAQTPNILAIAGFLGLIGQILALAGLIWMFVCGVVATSISLRVSTGRALIIALIAGIIALIAGIIALIVLSIVGSLLDEPLM